MTTKHYIEKIHSIGPEQLFEEELLDVLTSTEAQPVPVGERLLCAFGDLELVFEASAEELGLVLGTGSPAVTRLIATREILDRLKMMKWTGAGTIHSTMDAYTYFASLASESQEVMGGLFLNSMNEVISGKEVFRGTIQSSVASPREILRAALRTNAAKFIVAHNHPSQHCEPSEEDRAFTAQLEFVAQVMGVPLVDHLIIGLGGNYFSFAEASLLGRPFRERGRKCGARSPNGPYRNLRNN